MGGMRANRFMSLLDVVSVRWQTEVEGVGSHIAPCVPASVKSGGLAWRTEYLRTEGNSRLWRLRQQSLKQEARGFSRGRRSLNPWRLHIGREGPLFVCKGSLMYPSSTADRIAYPSIQNCLSYFPLISLYYSTYSAIHLIDYVYMGTRRQVRATYT